jgi:hypothetical protein
VDTLLGKLDEFEQLMVLSQSDANVCLFKHVPGLQTKFTEMQSVFDKIDRYEFLSISYVFLKLPTSDHNKTTINKLSTYLKLKLKKLYLFST